MAVFHHAFSDPFQPEEVDLGYIEGYKLKQTFLEWPWEKWLHKMEVAATDDFHSSPTLNISQRDQKREMLLSALIDKGQTIFYVFYRRPKIVKSLFGLVKKHDEKYTTELLDQTKEQAAQLLEAFVNGDDAYLDERIK
ncbi:hypothetical protein [Nibribacter koreensis]|uniref:Uncharacterized protein n=1 Tax=Nibribacter koreensis TaxID=1084519 RepID=A0ABP8FFK0_9BACT